MGLAHAPVTITRAAATPPPMPVLTPTQATLQGVLFVTADHSKRDVVRCDVCACM
jgi:hypothetical protein